MGQEQLKEAEKLLATTKHERNNLLVENHALKKGNQELRRDLIAAERDTQETKIELEMIESMVQSMDNISSGKGSRMEQRPIKPHHHHTQHTTPPHHHTPPHTTHHTT